jgi:Mn2+/Fe2+ NRAMP family transporter
VNQTSTSKTGADAAAPVAPSGGRNAPPLPEPPGTPVPDPATGAPAPSAHPIHRRFVHSIGPGLVTGAADDDPSGIATYSSVAAQFGYQPLWTMLAAYPLMSAVQIIAARLGRTTGRGIAGNLVRRYPNLLVRALVLIVFTANAINIGADLGAMADAGSGLVGGPYALHAIGFALVCVGAQVWLTYERYARVLRWLALALFAYVAGLFFVHVPWGTVATNLVVPTIRLDGDFITALVAIAGTTISPYLFFWQSAQEVEETQSKPEREPLRRAPEQAPSAEERINIDTLIGMAVSNIVALAIMILCAATLNASGVTEIHTSADAARALEPIAGPYAAAIFTLGVVGTGLLAVPVLAGSAAYAVGEAFRFRVGFDEPPRRAIGFYATLTLATAIGLAMGMLKIDPIKALYWSAVLNGIVAVPVLAMMMLIATDRRVMGDFTIRGWLRGLGWATTAVMGVMVAAMALGFG